LVACRGTLDYGCAVLIDRNNLPNHLFGVPDLDLSDDLCVEPLAGPWFGLGASSAGSGRDKQGVLWFEIEPPAIDTEDPWAEDPPFDPYTFTLPTDDGPVASARWGYFRKIAGRKFDGVTCHFMTPVFFRQEVLVKYQGSSGFDVRDDGSVSYHGEWELHSTWRLGNELFATGIGDFGKGVPFREWSTAPCPSCTCRLAYSNSPS